MVKSLKVALVAAAALGSVSLASTSASAMPMAGKAAVTVGSVEKVGWVCGPFRCFWRPYYGFYGGPRYGWRGYGWRGYGWRGYGWRRW